MMSALEERLIGSGLITHDQLARAHVEGRLSGKSFWAHLVRLGYLSETDLARFLARQLRVPFLILNDYQVDARVLELVDEELARRHLLLPLFLVNDVLFVAMANPGNVVALDEVRTRTRLSIEPVMTVPTELRDALDLYYGTDDVFGTTLEYVQIDPPARLSSSDTRQHRRAALRLPLLISIATPGVVLKAPQPFTGELVDVSRSGAMLELPWFLPPGTKLQLQLQTGAGRPAVRASGQVVSCQERVLTYQAQLASRQRVSVQFVDLDAATQAALARLVDSAPA